MTTPYDDLPIDVRRLNWGWFGEAWPSFICYDADGRLLEEMRKPTPQGEDCLFCGEPIEAGHSGQALPAHTHSGVSIRHAHKECLLRNVLGSPDHLDGKCSCRNHTPDKPARSYREEALEVWARFNERDARSAARRQPSAETT